MPQLQSRPSLTGQPLDKTAYAIHFLAGVAILAPWNSLLTAGDYFEASLPGIPITRLVTAAYLPPTLLFALALLGRHESTRPRARIIVTFTAFTVLVVLLPVLDATLGCRVATVMAVAACVGIFDGLGQPAVYGETALLPGPYTQAVVAGTAASGLVTSLLRVLCKAATSAAGGGRLGVSVFFGTSAAECAAAAVLYGWWLPRTRVWRMLAEGHEEARELLPEPTHAGAKGAIELAPTTTPLDPETPARPLAPTVPPTHRHPPPPNRRRVAAHVWPTALAMVCVYAATISLFPGAFVDQVPRFGDWFFVLIVLLFNGADFMGKMVPAIPAVARTLPAPKTLLCLAVARAAFVPALIFAARAPNATTAAVGVAIVCTLLGVTNGYVTAGCYIKASEGLRGRDAEDAGTVAVIALISGLIVGSALSFLFEIGKSVL